MVDEIGPRTDEAQAKLCHVQLGPCIGLGINGRGRAGHDLRRRLSTGSCPLEFLEAHRKFESTSCCLNLGLIATWCAPRCCRVVSSESTRVSLCVDACGDVRCCCRCYPYSLVLAPATSYTTLGAPSARLRADDLPTEPLKLTYSARAVTELVALSPCCRRSTAAFPSHNHQHPAGGCLHPRPCSRVSREIHGGPARSTSAVARRMPLATQAPEAVRKPPSTVPSKTEPNGNVSGRHRRRRRQYSEYGVVTAAGVKLLVYYGKSGMLSRGQLLAQLHQHRTARKRRPRLSCSAFYVS